MQAKILEIKRSTPTTYTFILEKPVGFVYKPGQFVQVKENMPDPDPRGNRRSLSLASSPTEDVLQITTQDGPSMFKQYLHNKKVQDTIEFIGPLGHFVLDEGDLPALILAGGIGITPFRSMILYAADKKLSKPIVLIHSNRNQSDILFLEEFKEAEKRNPNFKLIETLTQETDPNWTGQKGRITPEFLNTHVPDFKDRELYVCGSVPMVHGVLEMLHSLGLPDEQINREQFSGYA